MVKIHEAAAVSAKYTKFINPPALVQKSLTVSIGLGGSWIFSAIVDGTLTLTFYVGITIFLNVYGGVLNSWEGNLKLQTKLQYMDIFNGY